ncbi:MAG: hypothetical protein ACKOSQ_03150 [Planctomycetaceae bacterium]
MRPLAFASLAGLGLVAGLVAARASDIAEVYPGCTGPRPCAACVPACKATWEEKKSSKPVYSMKCEYACARGRDSWHAPPPECRCRPPCGTPYVKKRLYKADGCEKVEREPKYEVVMVPAAPCDCPACRGCGPLGWLNPFRLFH